MATTDVRELARVKQTETPEGDNGTPTPESFTAANVVSQIERIEVECVVNGCLQRIRFAAGTNPADVGPMIRTLDPGAVLRDSFPTRGGGGRQTKEAKVLVITMRAADAGLFIDLTAETQEDAVSISVPRKQAATFIDTLRSLNALKEKSLEKLQHAVDSKSSATVVLGADEVLTARYWISDDSRCFLDSLVAGGGHA
ncbi:MAG: hypothetical protein ACLFU6_12805 [Candidatus Hydrogenedentota bacterium]